MLPDSHSRGCTVKIHKLFGNFKYGNIILTQCFGIELRITFHSFAQFLKTSHDITTNHKLTQLCAQLFLMSHDIKCQSKSHTTKPQLAQPIGLERVAWKSNRINNDRIRLIGSLVILRINRGYKR